jgi:hypothetical protein
MVDSVSSNYTVNYTTAGSTRHSSMSSDQKSAVQEILSNYDAKNLSVSDAKEISNSFKEQGIRPSSELRETIQSAGFDADAIREMSGSGGVQGMEGKQPPPPPPPPSDQASNSEQQSIIEEILEEILNGDDEDDTSYDSTDQIMDYTSRIMNLNEDAQNEVKSLFEQFKPGNSDFSAEDSKNIVTNALKSILSNDENYNHIEIYG